METDQKFIYGLGGGCWSYADIPFQYRADSLFKGTFAIYQDYFTPKCIFDMEFFSANWFDYRNWECTACKTEWLKGHVFDLHYLNRKLNLELFHVNIFKEEPTDINLMKMHLDEFEKNKYRYFFIIDFQRGNYQFFTNEQLLDFEDTIGRIGFDFRHFVYIDVGDAKVKNRFDNCKVPVFINDVRNPLGFGNETTPELFRNTRCFFAEHMDYVKNISGIE